MILSIKPLTCHLGTLVRSGTDGGTDAKSKSPVFTGLGTLVRLYTPKALSFFAAFAPWR